MTTLSATEPLPVSTHPVEPAEPTEAVEPMRAETPRPEAGSASSGGSSLAQGLRILRGLGGLVLVASVSPFLVQQWADGSDVTRYLTLLAYSVLVGLAGIFCAVRLQENKGARTFLGVALLGLPIHTTVLGALLYSRLALDGALRQLPSIATWEAPSALVAVGLVLGAAAVLGPIVWMAVLTLARPRAKALFPAFVGANACLLLPVRAPELVAPVVLILALALVRFDLGLRRHPAMETGEGRFVRLLLGVPLVLLVGRSIWLYEPSALFFGTLFATLAGLLFLSAPHLAERARAPMRTLAAVPTALAWILWTRPIVDAFLLPTAPEILLVGLPMAGAFGFIGAKLDGGVGAAYRRAAAVVALGTVLLPLVVAPSVLASLLCLAVAIATVVYAFLGGHRLLFASGLFGVAVGLAFQLRYAAELFAWSRWGSLAVLGAAAILTASWLERNQGRVAASITAFRRRMS